MEKLNSVVFQQNYSKCFVKDCVQDGSLHERKFPGSARVRTKAKKVCPPQYKNLKVPPEFIIIFAHYIFIKLFIKITEFKKIFLY